MARRLLAAAVLVLAAVAAVHGQTIALTRGSVGCVSVRPGPVENLRAVPGDGFVELSWDRSRDGEQHRLGDRAAVAGCLGTGGSFGQLAPFPTDQQMPSAVPAVGLGTRHTQPSAPHPPSLVLTSVPCGAGTRCRRLRGDLRGFCHCSRPGSCAWAQLPLHPHPRLFHSHRPLGEWGHLPLHSQGKPPHVRSLAAARRGHRVVGLPRLHEGGCRGEGKLH